METLWACEIEHLRAYCEKVLRAGVETEKAAALFFSTNKEEPRPILTVDGDTATIDIQGTLTNQPSIIGSFLRFRSTSYTDIQEAIKEIAANDDIKKVRLAIDSPGGYMTGLDETWMALRDLSKTHAIVAENHGLMASAAYWLATAAQKIVTTSPSAETGAIGIYMMVVDWTEYDKNMGIKEIRIVSKNAPLKNPDAATKQGLAALQSRLDALERVFISRVAEGRKLSAATVEKDFGRGSLLIAQDPDPSKPSAMSVGMIDAVLGIAAAGRDGNQTAGDTGGDLEAGTPPFTDLPIVDKAWNADAAIKRIRRTTGSTEKAGPAYKQAFFWHDRAKAEDLESYKLPFADVVDGKLKAVRKGVFSAKAAMSDARGNKQKITTGDVAGVNSHIDKYVKKIENLDQDIQGSAAAENRKGQNMATYAELTAENPDLKKEIDDLVAAAVKKGQDSAKASELALTVLASEAPDYVKGIATKVIKGEATEAELAAAQGAFDAMKEKEKADAAAGESGDQPPTPPHPPPEGNSNGEIKTEQDHQEAVARLRKIKGMEEK